VPDQTNFFNKVLKEKGKERREEGKEAGKREEGPHLWNQLTPSSISGFTH
jgi:hypothetical protein